MSLRNIQRLPGFRDFLPSEAIRRDWLKNKIKTVFEQWGYDPLETPTLEPLEIFEGAIGEDEKLFYKFEDPGGRKVALRYDQTVPACRVVGQHQNELPLPFRRYQVQSAFRAEKPQKGRFREFLQADADIWGVSNLSADAEAIALSLDIYREIGFFKYVVKVNDRKLLKEFPYEALVSVDKLAKIGPRAVLDELQKKGVSQNQAQDYLNQIQNLKPNQTIEAIFEILKAYGFPKESYQFDPTIVRSFAYSNGPVWEVEIPGYAAGSVLGGERYDTLTQRISGREIVGTGFGLGFDRTFEAAEQFGLIPDIKTTTKVLVTIFEQSYYSKSVEIANLLRQSFINTELYPDFSVKLEKQLKYANQKGIEWVVIVGPKEVEKEMVTIRKMSTGEQKLIEKSQVVNFLKVNAQKSEAWGRIL